jgi:hypothetical protein
MANRGRRWKGRALSAFVFVLVLSGLSGCMSAMPGGSSATSNVDVDPWPRQLTSGDHTFSIFQPQYEGWDQDRLSGRAAVVVENPVSPEPQYGVIRFTARTEVDKETRIVTLEDVTITKADFPTAPEGGAVYLAALRQALSAQPLTIALDRLRAELEVQRTEDPPRIMVLKGQPALSPITGTDILEVTNTDDDLFLYTPQQEYYALLSGRWFRAGSLQGPWEFVASGDLPPDFARIGGFRGSHGVGGGVHGGSGHGGGHR